MKTTSMSVQITVISEINKTKSILLKLDCCVCVCVLFVCLYVCLSGLY